MNRQFGAGTESGLADQIVDVIADGGDTQEQPHRDLPIREALTYQPQDIHLPGGEIRAFGESDWNRRRYIGEEVLPRHGPVHDLKDRNPLLRIDQ